MNTGLYDSRLPFVVDVGERFTPDRVLVRAVDVQRPTTPELDALIESEWERRMAEAHKNERMLFNGPMLRYVDHALETNRAGARIFRMTVGPSCYRDFVGTNLYNHHRLPEFGWHRFANPIGTTAILVTADSRICFGVRSSRVSYHASHVHTFGGSFEGRDRRPDGSVDPFESLTRELKEELDLNLDELVGLACVGLIRDNEIHQPEMLFEARLTLEAAALRKRWIGAECRDEHDDLVTIRDAPEAIVPFIKSAGLIAPVAIGALFLHGDQSWGREWSQRAADDYAL